MFIHLQGSHKKLEEKGSGWVCTIFALNVNLIPIVENLVSFIWPFEKMLGGGRLYDGIKKSLFKTNNVNHGQVEYFYSYCFKSEITFDHFHDYGSDPKLCPRKNTLIYNLQGKNGMRKKKKKKSSCFIHLEVR